jgi:hypothetical protein
MPAIGYNEFDFFFKKMNTDPPDPLMGAKDTHIEFLKKKIFQPPRIQE